MHEIKAKLKRQAEILGFVLNNPGKYNIYDFEEIYEVNDLTIKRDLRELRDLGIDIHSKKKKGIYVCSKISDDITKNLIIQYIGIAVNQSSYDQATNLLVQNLNSKSISFITLLQKCVDENSKIKIKYLKAENGKTEERIISPYCIFQSDKSWRLLSEHEGKIKQFLINRVKEIERLEQTFIPPSQKQIDEIFSTSFRSWLGNEEYKVKLKFLPPWPERIKPLQLMEDQKMEIKADGTMIFETVVNSLKEIASWVVSRGKGVIVLEPAELRNIVINTAKEALLNYEEKVSLNDTVIK